jgi:hypothetical protein
MTASSSQTAVLVCFPRIFAPLGKFQPVLTLATLGRHEVHLTGAPKRSSKNTPHFDLRMALARWAGVDLTRSTDWP